MGKREGCARTLGASFFFSAKIILQLQHVAIAPTIPSFATIPFLMALVQKQGVEFAIQPQATAPAIDTSEWPLLLKDYDKRESPHRRERKQIFDWEICIGSRMTLHLDAC